MIYLAGSLACGALFAQSYKFAVARGYDVDWVSLASFASSALFLVLSSTGSSPSFVLPAVGLGIVYGIAGGISQVTFFRALRHGDLSVSWTIVQLSTLLPILASIFYWHEQPTLRQGMAIGGMVVAVLLMGNVELRLVQEPLAWLRWMGIAYLFSGITGICMKFLETNLPAHAEFGFLLTGYLVSVGLTMPLIRSHRPGRRELGVGAVRGAAILAANWLSLKAIQVLPGYLVFSIYSAVGVTVNALLALLIWGERPRRWAYGGIAIAILSIATFSI